MMMIKKIIIFSLFVLTANFSFPNLNAQIFNHIVVKVGGTLITHIDVQNEIITSLILSKQEITQENIDNSKDFAVKKLINNAIKKNEINRFKIKDYSKSDLRKYVDTISGRLNTDRNGLKEIFNINNISFESFVEKHKTELLWNTLIFSIYRNQINLNIIEIENEIEKEIGASNIEYNISEIEISNEKYKKNKFNEILRLIEKENFELVAKKFSIAPSAIKGGTLGWISRETLSKEYLKQIEKLNNEEISSPIIKGNSVLIIKLNDVKKSKNTNSYNEIKNKILLLKKEEKLSLFSRSHFSNLENTITIKFL